MKQVATCRTAMLQLAQGIFNQLSKIMLAYWQRRKQFRLIKHMAEESLVQLFSFELQDLLYFMKSTDAAVVDQLSRIETVKSSRRRRHPAIKNLNCEKHPTPPAKRGKRWFTFITLSCMETRRISQMCVVGDTVRFKNNSEEYEFRFI